MEKESLEHDSDCKIVYHQHYHQHIQVQGYIKGNVNFYNKWEKSKTSQDIDSRSLRKQSFWLQILSVLAVAPAFIIRLTGFWR